MSSSTSSSERPRGGEPSPRSLKGFVGYVALFLVMNLAIVHSVNYVIDPLQVFRKQNTIAPLFSEDQRHQVPGLIRHFAPEAKNAIVGSSLTSNMRASLVTEVLGGETVKLSIDGSTASEQLMVARYLMSSGGDEMRNVIWAVDPLGYYRTYGELSQPAGQYPLHLYGEGLELAEYTLSIDTLTHSARTLISWATGISFFQFTTRIDDLNTWDQKALNTGCGVVIKEYYRAEGFEWEKAEAEDGSESDPLDRYLGDFQRLLRDNRRTTFHFFFPPISILRTKLMQGDDKLESFGELRHRFTEAMLGEPNIRVYDLQDDFDITENLDYYRDTGHYDARISRRVLEEIAAGRTVRSVAEVDEAFLAIKVRTQAFDVEKADAECDR